MVLQLHSGWIIENGDLENKGGGGEGGCIEVPEQPVSQSVISQVSKMNANVQWNLLMSLFFKSLPTNTPLLGLG